MVLKQLSFYLLLFGLAILCGCSFIDYKTSNTLINNIKKQEYNFYNNPNYTYYINNYKLYNCVILYNNSSLLISQAIYSSPYINYCILDNNIVEIIETIKNNEGVIAKTTNKKEQIPLLNNFNINNYQFIDQKNQYDSLFKEEENFLYQEEPLTSKLLNTTISDEITISNINQPTNTYLKKTILQINGTTEINRAGRSYNLINFKDISNNLPKELLEEYLNLQQSIINLMLKYNINYYEIK